MKPVLRGRRRRGYILLEVITAAGVFAMAGIGLVVALNDLSHTFIRARRVTAVRVQLESKIAELRVRPLVVTKEKAAPDTEGVVYEKEVELLELQNDDKILLENLYRITIKAYWKEGVEDQEEEAEIYVYQP